MIGNLWTYFGVTGIVAVLLWLAAVVVLGVFARRRRRLGRFAAAALPIFVLFLLLQAAGWTGWITWLAILLGLLLLGVFAFHRQRGPTAVLALAVLAFFASMVNSGQVNAIRVDRSAAQAAALNAEQRRMQRMVSRRSAAAADVQFAEDTQADRLDLAGVESSKQLSKYERALQGADEQQPRYEFMNRGKEEREEGKSRRIEGISDGKEAAAEEEDEFTLPPDRLAEAHRYDRANLWLTRLFVWLCVGLVAVEYLLRFNRTDGAITPVPITGRWLDALFPKTRSVCVRPERRQFIAGYLDQAVRKGETFIYCGSRDPWQAAGLPRIAVGDRSILALTKIAWPAPDQPVDPEFVLDAAWFDRYCFTVTDRGAAERLISELTDYLEIRRMTRAWARATVNLAWDFDEPLNSDRVEQLAYLGRMTNLKLLVHAGDRVDEIAPLVEEVYPDDIERENARALQPGAAEQLFGAAALIVKRGAEKRRQHKQEKREAAERAREAEQAKAEAEQAPVARPAREGEAEATDVPVARPPSKPAPTPEVEIGRASCRERV